MRSDRKAWTKHFSPQHSPDLALGRMKDGQKNKTEQAYEEHLELLRQAGEIRWYQFEPWNLRLANGTWYKPDFGVIGKDGVIECHEVKGFWRDDARVKIKVAANLHPFRFIAVQKRSKKDGGGWKLEYF